MVLLLNTPTLGHSLKCGQSYTWESAEDNTGLSGFSVPKAFFMLTGWFHLGFHLSVLDKAQERDV